MAETFTIHKLKKCVIPSTFQTKGHSMWMVTNDDPNFKFIPIPGAPLNHIEHIHTSACDTCVGLVDAEFLTSERYRSIRMTLGIHKLPFMLLELGGDGFVKQAALYYYNLADYTIKRVKSFDEPKCSNNALILAFSKLETNLESGILDTCTVV